jgi:hypothetical protein
LQIKVTTSENNQWSLGKIDTAGETESKILRRPVQKSYQEITVHWLGPSQQKFFNFITAEIFLSIKKFNFIAKT